jgi:nucleotide-binding universal stress UspA family protein
MFQQNVVIALPLEDKLLHPLYAWGKRFDWSHVQGVHFLHIVKKTITPLEFGLIEVPNEKAYKEMKPTLEKFLREEAKKILPTDFKQEVYFHLELDMNPEEEIIELLKKFRATMVVVSTTGRHGFEGLFHGSFTDHMVKFAPCDVFVIRPDKK